MQVFKNMILAAVWISFLVLTSCNESPKNAGETNTDTSAVAKNETSVPAYDPAIDPLIVASAFTKKLAGN